MAYLGKNSLSDCFLKMFVIGLKPRGTDFSQRFQFVRFNA
jgi:hypothetical protein